MRSVIVIGGGASGLAAAVSAAENGAEVTILERLPRVGKKILLTGNGRCNLGHEGFDWARYHGSVPQARAIMERFDVKQYFRRFGLLTRSDAEGRIYPMSGTAASVLDALRFAAEQRGVRILCDMQARSLRQNGKRWTVTCGEKQLTADAVIIAAGGSASPSCGTDGNLFPLLRKMGYRIQEPKPALCPVPTEPARVKALKGLRVRAAVSALQNGRILQTETGEVQFAEGALSGICVFNLSRYAAKNGKNPELALDLLPDMNAEETAQIMQMLRKQRGSLPAGDLLTGLLPKRIGETLLKQCGGNCNQPAKEISENTQKKLEALLHDWRFPVTGTASFAQAQVTGGGVDGACVNEHLESLQHAELFFCGEILDIDGDCGGYNLTWSWASGAAAGKYAAKGKSR